MRARWTFVAVAVALGGISAPAQAQENYHHYECEGGAKFEIAFFPGSKAAFLQLDGKSIQLPKRFSLISQRFKKDGISVAMRSGGKALLKRGDGKTLNCQAK